MNFSILMIFQILNFQKFQDFKFFKIPKKYSLLKIKLTFFIDSELTLN